MDRVGAVMPTWNMGQFLEEAIESVVHQVDKLVIVDDASSDDTVDILLNRSEDVVKLTENLGTAEAINYGIDRLRKLGDFKWLTWVSSDNVCYANWIKRALEEDDGQTGAIYSGMDCRSTEGLCPDHYSFRQYSPPFLGNSTQCHMGCSYLIRADVWQDHRGQYAHDYDNWLRVEEACWAEGLRIIGIDEALAMYRVHKGQRTRRPKSGSSDARKWLEEARKRRRRRGIRPPSAPVGSAGRS